MSINQYTHWAENTQWTLSAGGEKRVINVMPDMPDHRDYGYTPPLIRVKASLQPDYKKLVVLDQQNEGACTGFGLAATINFLAGSKTDLQGASPRMLYEMARKHDEWPGMKYEGSSCRGAIKGWYAMGVCKEDQWKYDTSKPGDLTVTRAKAAREIRVGAYYRLNQRLADFHAAINETGAIFVSASIHQGWMLKGTGSANPLPKIIKPAQTENQSGHAFSIVGYNDLGFIVQNSWGKSWGRKGFALWTYEDWYENIRDAWVFRLSLSTPAIWQVSTRLKVDQGKASTSASQSKPIRSEIAGHFAHIDDGKFHDYGQYWSNLKDIQETASLLANSSQKKYQHLVFYAHGGLNTPTDSAKRIRGMKEAFKGNGVYPFHFMYDTGMTEEIKDVILRKITRSSERAGSLSDASDYAIEKLIGGMGRAVWREMKSGAEAPFFAEHSGWNVVQAFLAKLSGSRPDIKIHLVGHSTGAILLAYMLEVMEAQFPTLRVSSVSLMAPAATTALFYSHYRPLLEIDKNHFGIDEMTVYNLSDKLERKDSLAHIYHKSLLYLVSRAFEDKLGGDKKEDTEKKTFGARLLGMQRYSVPLDRRMGKSIDFIYSGTSKGKGRTASNSHGGFDNDPQTMNDILMRITGSEPKRPFTQQDLA
ncbi:MAG: C1 family peptidase [Arenicellales bacterium]